MVIDTSAIIAILLDEPERAAFDRHIEADPVRLVSAVGQMALEAFRRFGKGRHQAGLNIGDCFAYTAAKATGEKLLFKGDDFSRTDIPAALSA
jgi:ribonuclease VapC